MKKLLPYYALLKEDRLRWFFIGAVFFGILNGLAGGAGIPFLVKYVFPVLFADIKPDDWVLIGVVLYIPAIFFVRGASGFFNTYLINYCGVSILETIRLKTYTKMQHLPLAFYQKQHSGDIYSRLINDTQILQESITTTANDVVKQPSQLIGAIGFLIYYSVAEPEMGFVILSLGVIPLCVFPVRYMGKKLLKRARHVQEEISNLSQCAQENLGALKEVRSFNLQDKEINRFALILRAFFKFQMKVVKYSAALSPAIETITACGVTLAIYFSAKRGVSLEEVIALVAALYFAYDPIKKLGNISPNLFKGTVAMERIEFILKTESSLPEPIEPIKSVDYSKGVVFKDLSFSYEDKTVLQNIDVNIASGQAVALVGPSGAGKSTFVHLISRFYDPEKGSVSVGGVDIRKVLKKDLRDNISIVAQEPVLFNFSLLDNIRLGHPEADKELVIAAAKKAFAHDFIMEQENGYDTIVGEKGSRLSVGQKQRVAIARAFLKDSPLLILDEATSALDSESEAKIQAALGELIKGKTVFIIAHRFSTIQKVNRILVFKDGRIIGDGVHSELHQNCPVYKALYDHQTQ